MSLETRIFNAYFATVKRLRIFIIVFWLVVLGVSVIFGPKFLDHTKTTFDAPPGTPAHDAEQVFQRAFEGKPLTAIVLIENTKGKSVINNFVEEVTGKIEDAMKNWNYPGQFDGVAGYYTFVSFPLLARNFVSNDFRATFIEVSYNRISNQQEANFIKYLQDITKKLNTDSEHVVGLTGMDVLFYEVITSQQDDMVHTDSIVIPGAMCVLAYTIRSVRLMVIPFIGVMTSLFTSWAIMLPISYNFEVAAFAPSIMGSLIIAMSIDYSLFLLTRYGEEIKKGRSNEVAVELMTRYGGHIVMISGTTLAITFLGLAFFPLSFLQSIGIGAAIALLTTITVNLTLTPAVLMTFPTFFANFELPAWCINCTCLPCCNRKDPRADVNEKAAAYTDPDLQAQKDSAWFKIARCATSPLYSWVIILSIFAVTVPLGLQLLNLHTTIDNTQLFPRDAESLAVYTRLQNDFSAGAISPYYIIADTDHPSGIWSPEYFAKEGEMLKSVFASKTLDPTWVTSVTNLKGLPVDWLTANVLINNKTDPSAILYQIMFKGQVNTPANNTALISISTEFDPLGDNAEPWVKQLRKALEKFQTPGLRFYVTGGAAQAIDAVDRIYDLFPMEIGITAAIVFLIVGVMFRSLFVPIRLLITIALPICLVFGLGILCFTGGVLGFKPVKALYWLTPVMSFSILVGLGLDYDVFLFSRVVEYRKAGYSDRASITKGMYKTGRIITAAGIIMSIAFGGLLFSKQMALNQFGFMLCIAVLVDTFVVRTLMVPAIMSLARSVNWWPGHVPKADKTEEDMDADDLEGPETLQQGKASNPPTGAQYEQLLSTNATS